MFNLPWFYLTHAFLIGAGVLLMLASLYIVLFMKKKKWRIKRHKQLSLGGNSLIILGVILMFVGKQIDGWPHFTSPHGIGGLLTFILMLTTPALAFLGMKGNRKLLKVHKWFGRVTGTLMVLVALFGLINFLSLI